MSDTAFKYKSLRPVKSRYVLRQVAPGHAEISKPNPGKDDKPIVVRTIPHHTGNREVNVPDATHAE